eukprot:gene5512-7487_t
MGFVKTLNPSYVTTRQETLRMASANKLDPIPHPPKKPVVGNMLSLDSVAPVQHLARPFAAFPVS